MAGPSSTDRSLAAEWGSRYNIDPNVLLAIACHESGYGYAANASLDWELGCGATDSGFIEKYRGQANQYPCAAATLARTGVHTIDDIANGKASDYATDPAWEQGVIDCYKDLTGKAPSGRPSPGSGQPTLRQGDTGPAVTLLQQSLKNLGFDPGPIDGDFGPKTLAAVKAFQTRDHLTVDGIVGPETWAHLVGGVSGPPSTVSPGSPGSGPLPSFPGSSPGVEPGSRLQYGEPSRLPGTGAPYEPFPGGVIDRSPSMVREPGRFGTGSVAVGQGVPTSVSATGVPSRAPAEPYSPTGPVFAKALPSIEAAASLSSYTDDVQLSESIRALAGLGP